ncbi:RsiV family protein [Bacteroides sp.]|uniref:RsiV family protein n=1 Tax=Bacteroides sp. TaxID=29523 RepID=UPI003AB44917
MKKQTVSLLVLLLAASGFFFSCGNTVNKNAGALEFDSIQVNETAHLFGDTAKPACNITISFAYIDRASDVRLKDSLNAYFLSLCFGDRYMAMTPEEAVEQYTGKYIGDYRNDLEPMYKKDEQEKEDEGSMEAWYSYYKYIKSQVQLYTKHLLVYRYRYEEFTGGAHGIYMTTFLNMDLRTLSPIRLDDLFVSDYEGALTDLLWNQLMADNKVATRQELEDLGYATTGNLEPTENFYLSPEGITFYYNVYDIAPYVMGPVQITLPYEMVQHLLSDGSMILNEVRE